MSKNWVTATFKRQCSNQTRQRDPPWFSHIFTLKSFVSKKCPSYAWQATSTLFGGPVRSRRFSPCSSCSTWSPLGFTTLRGRTSRDITTNVLQPGANLFWTMTALASQAQYSHIFTICLLVPACVLRRNIPSIERALPFSFRWLATNTFLCLWKGASIVKALQRRHPSDDHATTLLRGITTSVAVEPKVSKLFSAFRLTPLLLSRIIFFEYKKYEYNPKVAGEVKKEWGEEWQRNTRRRTEV